MQVVYEADNIFDANLIKGLLESAGLTAFVNGEMLTGGIGELPAAGLVRVAVPDTDVDRALDVVADFRRTQEQANGRGETRWDPVGSLGDWSG